ncbi:polysaccharide deacetylase family protein [Cognatiyoonia sp. IB215446]|uniref:polysaccharide deacetylase family protein n=1 Tax=Cognatiyoonia sp. IB215446 TaxID=3097355 RepID=UPI002A1154D6|nr:polysaccharide deacetylase family protein [Cognatiyoonia sp. IB215446]MDX8347331.1 polysaccharide deacetylase family protein [Cognatiyoonia sp. IB215446]
MPNLPHHGRYAYSAITDRPDFDWPDGRRLAVYLGMNLECFAFGEGLGAELAPGGPQPDVLNYGWRDYGNRVGAWRMLELFDRLSVPTTALVNSDLYEHAPGLIEAFRNRGDEIAGHGRTNAERQGVLDEDAERALIEEATKTVEQHEVHRPKGWLGPWISQSAVTPDLLEEAGYEYLLDWCHDDQPIWMKTRGGRILSVPYPQELNDIPQIVGRKREGAEFGDMICDAFDVMLEESTRRPLVMGIALHGYLMGHPHRLKHLERALRHIRDNGGDQIWWTTAGAISDHYKYVVPD